MVLRQTCSHPHHYRITFVKPQLVVILWNIIMVYISVSNEWTTYIGYLHIEILCRAGDPNENCSKGERRRKFSELLFPRRVIGDIITKCETQFDILCRTTLKIIRNLTVNKRVLEMKLLQFYCRKNTKKLKWECWITNFIVLQISDKLTQCLNNFKTKRSLFQ